MSKKNLRSSFTPSYKYPQKKIILILLLVFISFGIIIPLYFIWFSHSVNEKFGFPFDDPFIHLTFAKNLSEYFSFSYFRDEMVTSGSSSPLYTFILAAGFGLMKNEFLLGYLPGILFFTILIYFFYKISLKEFKSNFYFVIVSVLILILDKWIVFFSVSGMETTLFVCVLIASSYFCYAGKLNYLAISLSLIIWIRLEGIIFILAILADYLFALILFRKYSNWKKIKENFSKIFFIILPVFLSFLMYMLMNIYLSGSLFPNTFYAKKNFYSPEFMSREYFLQTEVMNFFTDGSYKILFPGFIISLITLFFDALKRKKNHSSLYFIFIFFFILAYWYEMPYAGQLGRYLIPLLPFYIIISVSGFLYLFVLVKTLYKNEAAINFIFYFLLLLISYYAGSDLKINLALYTKECDYIERTHIKPAKWILQNTNPGNVIATHEIGAIGFYSERKIIDVAGLVTPELIDKLADKNYIDLLQQFLKKNNVKYFATLSNWCRVVNAQPVYSGGTDDPDYETFEVYKYPPDSVNTIHFLSKEVSRLITIAEYNLKKNFPGKAIDLLNKAIDLDSNSSLSFYLKAKAFLRSGDRRSYETYLRKAVEIFPGYSLANLALADYYESENKSSEAEKFISMYYFHLNTQEKIQRKNSRINFINFR